MSVQREFQGVISFGDPAVTGGLSVHSREFDEAYSYDGQDLGNTYTAERTEFCVWAPTASEAQLALYRGEQGSGSMAEVHPMIRSAKGTWRCTVQGDLHGVCYTYRVRIADVWNEAVDPYVQAVAVNGDKGVILDLSKTNPPGWEEAMPAFTKQVDAIIYEVHVRDLTIHPESGVLHKGKYLGAAETGTRGPSGVMTGLDHIKDLGVTHVQFLPIFDYSQDSVDETKMGEPQYNWGYDPQNFNVPEGAYSTDPYDPACRIVELKTMIHAFHKQGLRVVMDVVYNHVYDAYRMHFMKLVPGYYYRYWEDGKLSNGSGCGNDVASERRMVRKFIVDSVLFWAQEYKIDGFRFDLMGLLDVDTMNEIRAKLDRLDRSILTYGEGWNMNTPLAAERKANQFNAAVMPRIGHFNDAFRDSLKGSVFYGENPGFVSGKEGLEHEIRKGIVGGIHHWAGIESFAHEPDQTVNYAEAHDNLTLWDKLEQSMGFTDDSTRRQAHKLASSVLLTSQGVTFIHAGQEFMRTKGGDDNSYRSSTEVNQLDWRRRAERSDEVEHMKQLIALRKAHPAFRLPTADEIRRHLVFEACPPGTVAFTLREHAGGDSAKHLYVVHNANSHEVELHIPLEGDWKAIFGQSAVVYWEGSTLKTGPYSTVVLACQP